MLMITHAYSIYLDKGTCMYVHKTTTIWSRFVTVNYRPYINNQYSG